MSQRGRVILLVLLVCCPAQSSDPPGHATHGAAGAIAAVALIASQVLGQPEFGVYTDEASGDAVHRVDPQDEDSDWLREAFGVVELTMAARSIRRLDRAGPSALSFLPREIAVLPHEVAVALASERWRAISAASGLVPPTSAFCPPQRPARGDASNPLACQCAPWECVAWRVQLRDHHESLTARLLSLDPLVIQIARQALSSAFTVADCNADDLRAAARNVAVELFIAAADSLRAAARPFAFSRSFKLDMAPWACGSTEHAQSMYI